MSPVTLSTVFTAWRVYEPECIILNALEHFTCQHWNANEVIKLKVTKCQKRKEIFLLFCSLRILPWDENSLVMIFNEDKA